MTTRGNETGALVSDPPSSMVPHCPQKRNPGGLEKPQFEHASAPISVPHVPQNRKLAGLSAPQLAHAATAAKPTG
jgi:hypothetical protein